MPKKNNTDREDLMHILATCLTDEGYEVDTETEREISRLAKFIILKANDETESDDEDVEDMFRDTLFDEYEDSEEHIFNTEEEE